MRRSLSKLCAILSNLEGRCLHCSLLHSADSEFYALQHERSRLLTDKDAIQTVYEELVKTYNVLKEDHVCLLFMRQTRSLLLTILSLPGGSVEQSRSGRSSCRRRR